jgi:hypothetical protein
MIQSQQTDALKLNALHKNCCAMVVFEDLESAMKILISFNFVSIISLSPSLRLKIFHQNKVGQSSQLDAANFKPDCGSPSTVRPLLIYCRRLSDTYLVSRLFDPAPVISLLSFHAEVNRLQ